MEFAQPWKRQRILKKEHIPDISQMINYLDRFDYFYEQALFVMAYQTGGRISEIVRLPFLRKVKYKKELINDNGVPRWRICRNENGSPIQEGYEKIKLRYPGILVRDLTFTEIDGKEILIVRMANRKNKNYKKKNIPIPVDREPEFVKVIEKYIEGKELDEPLFPFGVGHAEKIMRKIDMNPHFLRDIRLTHLVTVYNYNAHQLVKFAGWQNIAPAERYIRLGVNDLIANF